MIATRKKAAGPTERPLVLDGPSVRAILDGRKTQHRIPVWPIPFQSEHHPGEWLRTSDRQRGHGVIFDTNRRRRVVRDRKTGRVEEDVEYLVPYDEWLISLCPLGRVGDVLWIRETWQKSGLGWGNDLPAGRLHYRATDNGEWKNYWGNWKPSTQMPRWASRLTLKLTDVRLQNIRSMTEADADAEGSRHILGSRDGRAFDRDEKDWCRMTKALDPGAGVASARAAAAVLWDRGPRFAGTRFGDNPLCHVISFEVASQPLVF